MCTILIYTSPAQGHLYPVMDVALSLRQRGHRVHVRSLAAAAEVVRAAGLEASTLAPAIEARVVDDWQVSSQLASVKRSVRTFVDRAALEVDDLRQAMAEVRPDLLLIDTNAWGAQAVAEAEGIPWATWHPFPLPLSDPDVPPFGPGLAPARGPLGRLRDRLLSPLVIGPIQAVCEPLNRVRAKVGTHPFDHITELFSAPPAILYRTSEPFEYTRRHPPGNLHLIGPGLWSPPGGPEPAWLAADDKPILLVTCSSEYQNDGALAQAAIDAFGQDPQLRLVCTTAGVDPATVRAPAGVIVERFAPHAQVLPRAVGVVCHGGMGA
ncbi:MAG: glycosyltransferase, partial [Micropruina sp.]